MLLILSAVPAYPQGGRSSGRPADKWNRVETFRYRPSEPGSAERTFHFESREVTEDQHPVTRLRIQTPGQPEFVLTNEFSWWIKLKNDLPNWFSKRKNVLASQYVFGLGASIGATPHIFLFLVGWPFGSSPGSLDVVDLDGAKPPVVVLREEELDLVGFSDLDNDGVPEIIGAPCMSQEFGDHLLTYDPLHVYTIKKGGRPAELSIPLSRAYNEARYYGWVGPACSEEWAVVLHPPGRGRPVIMRTAEAEKLTNRPRKK